MLAPSVCTLVLFIVLLDDFIMELKLHVCDLDFRDQVRYTYERDMVTFVPSLAEPRLLNPRYRYARGRRPGALPTSHLFSVAGIPA